MSETNTIEGQVAVAKKNDFGFWSVKIEGDKNWYGAGKFSPGVEKGDMVSFQAYENDKGYQTIKGKVKKTGTAQKTAGGGKAGGTDWDAKDARISYQGARKIAVTEVQAYLAAGALKLPAKQPDILAAVQALIDETAIRIHELSYASTPTKPKAKVVDPEAPPADDAEEETFAE
jgi:hypothetical protein